MDSPTSITYKKQLAAQQLRLRRTLLATGLGLANSLALLFAWNLGYVLLSFSSLLIYFSISGLGYFIFPWLVKTQKNLKLADPSLTSYQIIWQIAMLSFCMFVAPSMRDLLIGFYILILLFGILRYKPKQIPVLAAFLFCSYVLVISLQLIYIPLQIYWKSELITGVFFVLSLVFVSLFGIEISGLRQALKRRNEHLAFLTDKNEQLAITDDLTGLYNRRYLMRILRRQKNLADRGNYNFSVLFVDLDHFKQINDRFGHAAGDLALKFVALRLRKSLRDIDYVARIGGEEFVVVLAQTCYKEALRTAERLRADIENLVISLDTEPANFTLTASFGVSCYKPKETIDILIQRADAAVYAAKNCGRNCIVGEDEIPVSVSTYLGDEDNEPVAGSFAAKF